jgi:hypothetical protein
VLFDGVFVHRAIAVVILWQRIRPTSRKRSWLRLSLAPTGEPKPFEAVLHVKVERGVPVNTELVALRERTP